MFSHSTPIIPRGSFQVACEKIGGSFRLVFRSIWGIIWDRGSFRVAYRTDMTQNKLSHIVDQILLSTKLEAGRKIKSPSKSKIN